MNTIKKWEVQRRLEEIERQLYWTGNVGRKELVIRFGISTQQASADLKTYLEQAGATVEFNRSTKRYYPTEGFTPILFTPSIEDYTNWTGSNGSLASVPLPTRSISPDVLCNLTQAIHQRCSIEICYRSLTNPQGSVRLISPHSLAQSSTRYHVRAYCHKRQDFRDFVLGRIVKTGDFKDPGQKKEDDTAWNTLVIARIAPHPELSKPQREVITADYAMKNDEVQIPIKQALLLYFLDQFNLDGYEATRPATIQQIILLNPEIRSFIK